MSQLLFFILDSELDWVSSVRQASVEHLFSAHWGFKLNLFIRPINSGCPFCKGKVLNKPCT